MRITEVRKHIRQVHNLRNWTKDRRDSFLVAETPEGWSDFSPQIVKGYALTTHVMLTLYWFEEHLMSIGRQPPNQTWFRLTSGSGIHLVVDKPDELNLSHVDQMVEEAQAWHHKAVREEEVAAWLRRIRKYPGYCERHLAVLALKGEVDEINEYVQKIRAGEHPFSGDPQYPIKVELSVAEAALMSAERYRAKELISPVDF